MHSSQEAKLYLESEIDNKTDTLLIIYNHGSDDETKLDLCTRERNIVAPVIFQLHNQKIKYNNILFLHMFNIILDYK